MTDAEPELMQRPALRPLRAEPATAAGRRGLALIDPTGLAEPTFVPAALVRALALCDGTRSLPAIAAGSGLPQGELREVLAELDRRLLLQGPRHERARAERLLAWRRAGARPARHAGSAGYPRDPERLRAALTAMVPEPERPRGPLRGLIAPHIDLQRGQRGYGAAYGALLAAEPADLYVLFGTGHQGPGAPVTGLPLDFATPLGRVSTNRDFVDAVHERIGGADPDDLLHHGEEHSLEFQALLLQHTAERRGGAPPQIAAFLCGALPSADGDPTQEDWFGSLVAAFRSAATATGLRICWVAGADLAHLGPFFGDPDAVDGDLLARLERDERARLAHLERGEPGAFHRAIAAEDNPDRICSAPAITLAALLAGGPAELLHYGQAAAEDGSQVVSFCAAAFAGSG